MKQKGQEAAPFELLIAVILMGFVLFVGLTAMKELERQQCLGKVNEKLSEMEGAIERVVNNKDTVSINFNFSSCAADESVVMKDWLNETYCGVRCGRDKKRCTILTYFSPAADVDPIEKCLDIPAAVEYVTEKDRGCDIGENYSLINLRDTTDDNPFSQYSGIPKGKYRLQYLPLEGDSTPHVCAFLEKR